MKKTITSAALVLAACCAARAQSIGPSTLNAGGGSGNIAGATYEYAIGEVVDGATLSSATLVVTQGVLQPTLPTSVAHGPRAITGLDVFPSPVETILYLQPKMGKRGRLEYSLYDAGGKLVLHNSAVLATGNERQEADVQALAVGQYTLQVSWLEGPNNYTGTYKIQKLK